MQGFRIHIARVLLVVFGFILTPNELIHEFFGHEDTRCNPGKIVTIEQKHVHCSILRLETRVFTPPSPANANPRLSCLQASFPALTVFSSRAIYHYANLRAPPQA